MAKNSNASFAYEALVSIILPEGILDVFEVVNVEEEHTGFIEETGLERRESTFILMSVTCVLKNGMTFIPMVSPKSIASTTFPSATARLSCMFADADGRIRMARM